MGIYESANHLFNNLSERKICRLLPLSGYQLAWPYLCCQESPWDKAVMENAWSNLVTHNRNKDTSLTPEILSKNICVVLDQLPECNSPAIKADKLVRLGLPLHYRLWRDKETSSVADSEMQASGSTEESWESSGCYIAKEWMTQCDSEIDLAEAYWIWRGVLGKVHEVQPNPVTTRVVAVDGIGMTGRLSVSLVDWKQHISFGVKPPKSGFVRSPMSFAYHLDESFCKSFSQAHIYLKSQKIWADDWVVEWDFQLGPSGAPSLTGGSAGAAIALATGALLARQHKRATS